MKNINRYVSIYIIINLLLLFLLYPNQASAASVVAASTPSELTELNLNGALIQLNLTGEEFKSTITTSNFDLVNEPNGSVIQSVYYNNPTSVNITISYTGQDFDGSISDFYIKAFKTGLVSGSADLSSNVMTITAITENITITSTPSPLTETNLNGNKITINLFGDTFINNLNISNFSLHVPAGMGVLNISSLQRINDTQVELSLFYDGKDFDADKTDFRVKVFKTGLVRTASDIESSNMTIYYVQEAITPLGIAPNPLIETGLNNATINLKLTGDTLIPNISSLYMELRNAPNGLSIARVERISDIEVKLTLAFNGTDFDADITNFRVRLFKDGLVRTTTDLETTDMVIYAVKEGVAGLLASSNPTTLNESSLDGSIINLTVREDEFQTTLVPTYFQLNNAPFGTSILNVYYINANSIRLILSFNNTDFDTDINNFSVTALAPSLKSGATLTSNTMIITATKEIEGQGDYVVTGESYPTKIEIAGYNSQKNEIYLNIDLITSKAILENQSALYDYFIEIYDSNSNRIGNIGTIDFPVSVTGSSSAQIRNEIIPLSTSLPTSYKIVVSVVKVTINN